MADKKISELTNITGANLADTDEFVVVDTSASETKAITRAELINGIVTTAGVTAAGALMDSELTDITAVKALDQGVATTDDPTFTNTQLAAIAASKAVSAVDVFVYDTSKDSDGGAWRKRTQHTSWYNETLNTATRGSRREFPAVAVIVAEGGKVTIYDGDDPALPMWMVFIAGSSTNIVLNTGVTAVSAVNGEIAFGQNEANSSRGGCARVGMISDSAQRHHAGVGSIGNIYNGTIAQRNSGLGWSGITPDIVNQVVNDVAMTVLPDAPIDPATGLPVPTIAVATAGGVSVIKDDGTVVDSNEIISAQRIAFDDQSLIVWYNSAKVALVYDAYNADGFTFSEDYDESGTLNIFLNSSTQPAGKVDAVAKNEIALGLTDTTTDSGLHLIKRGAMAAHVTSTYNTGWMPGDIKGAFLADTDDTDLVGYTAIDDDGSSATGWSDARSNGTVTSTGGRIRSTATASGAYGPVKTLTGLVVGKKYVYSADVFTGGGAGAFQFRITAVSDLNDTNTVNVGSSSDFSPSATFTATNSTMYVGVIHVAAAGGDYAEIDNISVKLADADRSVNANGLVVSGSITRTAVNSGADLVAYSGFSASNYLEQPYNSALDFGTGDFCVMGWVKYGGFDGRVVHRASAASGNPRFAVDTSAGKARVFTTNSSGAPVLCAGTSTLPDGQWKYICGLRRSGVLEIFVDGKLEATLASTQDITNSTATLAIGASSDGSTSLFGGSLALWRISGTAPTAEQIARIYQDERPLFTENAACTLYGASDAVTALAHDGDTGLLHVGTSAGRSVFQGLRRVSNTTTAVGTAISASNGLVVEE